MSHVDMWMTNIETTLSLSAACIIDHSILESSIDLFPLRGSFSFTYGTLHSALKITMHDSSRKWGLIPLTFHPPKKKSYRMRNTDRCLNTSPTLNRARMHGGQRPHNLLHPSPQQMHAPPQIMPCAPTRSHAVPMLIARDPSFFSNATWVIQADARIYIPL